jgi:hypothetical protein
MKRYFDIADGLDKSVCYNNKKGGCVMRRLMDDEREYANEWVEVNGKLYRRKHVVLAEDELREEFYVGRDAAGRKIEMYSKELRRKSVGRRACSDNYFDRYR